MIGREGADRSEAGPDAEADARTAPGTEASDAGAAVGSEAVDGGMGVAASAGAFLATFFAELERCGVREVVVSPGSRSTPLAMKALERFPRLHVDVDERGAAFFALGLAKATGWPVAVVCTSGTAVGNWMPAVLEAEASRVPLLLLSADRPTRLQHVGAPQTFDQIGVFGGHVRKFVQMPLPASDRAVLAYARQMALEACVAAVGAVPGVAGCDGGPVHLNFPFEEPLKPAPGAEGALGAATGRAGVEAPGGQDGPAILGGEIGVGRHDAEALFSRMRDRRVLALCGEGSVHGPREARLLLDVARRLRIPLLADPLSGLRQYDDPLVVDNYDSVFGRPGEPQADVVLRFGRWPVSKRCCQAIQRREPLQIVVDVRETRDFSSSTGVFVRATAAAFARAFGADGPRGGASADHAEEWVAANERAARRIAAVGSDEGVEGAYVDRMLRDIPDGSLLFAANSMSIRLLDTFYRKADRELTVLCNRGLNGIDGTLSSAIGAAQAFGQTTLLTGDLALLHDVNALALQEELLRDRRVGSAEACAPSVVVVCLNNGGGGIFDMLAQRSDEPYFARLFLTPHRVGLASVAEGFGVPHVRVDSVAEFSREYRRLLGTPGISLVEVPVPLEGVAGRHRPYW